MRTLLPILLLPQFAVAAQIPLESFDQSKLESLLRKMPGTLVREDKSQGFVRKHFSFPLKKSTGFSINCSSDFYHSASVPSEKRCEVQVSDGVKPTGDELRLQITDSSLVKALAGGIPYGQLYSTERLYGQSSAGKYRQIFRYIMSCQKESCELVFSPKQAL